MLYPDFQIHVPLLPARKSFAKAMTFPHREDIIKELINSATFVLLVSPLSDPDIASGDEPIPFSNQT